MAVNFCKNNEYILVYFLDSRLCQSKSKTPFKFVIISTKKHTWNITKYRPHLNVRLILQITNKEIVE